jgi:hypothetical protein
MAEITDIFYKNNKLEISSEAMAGVRIAYRLFKGNELVDKKGYLDAGESCFFYVPPSSGLYKIRIYKKDVKGISKFWTKEFLLSDIEKNQSDSFPENLEPSFFEIRKFKNPGVEISEYMNKGFLPMGRKDLTRKLLRLPIEWGRDVFSDRNWMFQLHAWRMLDPFLQRFLPEDVDYISELVNDWSMCENAVDHSGEEARWFWYDMSTGLRGLKLAYFSLMCQKNNVTHSIVGFNELVRAHIEKLADAENLNPGNHGLFQVNGLMALIYAWRHQHGFGFDAERDYALKTMQTLLGEQLGAHGVHTEDSPEYHFFVTKKITGILSSPWWSNESLGSIPSLLAKSQIAKSWLVDPLLRCVPVGDSGSTGVLKEPGPLREWPHKTFAGSIAAVLDGYGVVRSTPETDSSESHFLFFQGGFHSNVHKHADCLSFVLQENGRNILIDSGKYGYKSDKYRGYFQSSYAHNTITVDRKSLSRVKRTPYGSAIFGDINYVSGYWVLKGYVEHTEAGYSHGRIVVYSPNLDLYVIDVLENKIKNRPRRSVELSWNFDSRFFVSGRGGRIQGFDSVSNENFMLTCASTKNDVDSQIYVGNEGEDGLRGWVSPSYLKYEPSPLVVLGSYLDDKQVFLTRIQAAEDNDALISIQQGVVVCNDPELSKEISLDSFCVSDWKTKKASHYNDIIYNDYKNINHYFKEAPVHSENLFVSFHGAIKPDTPSSPGSVLPVFRFHNLNFPNRPHVLCFSDLILDIFRNDKVYLAWFLDTKKIKQRDIIEFLIGFYVKKYSIKNILFYGSSGGGHVALDMAARFNQPVMLSNCQFDLPKHSQFSALDRAVSAAKDSIMPFDLETVFNGRLGPSECISYCNVDDNTLEHHQRMEDFLSKRQVKLSKIHFSGDAIAKKNGVRNHSVGFPDGVRAQVAIEKYYLSLI